MMYAINYGEKVIEIHYSKYNLIDGKNNIINRIVRGFGESECGECGVAEFFALIDLTKKAVKKRPHLNLERIIVFEQNVSSDEKGKDLKYSLTGYPIFGRKIKRNQK